MKPPSLTILHKRPEMPPRESSGVHSLLPLLFPCAESPSPTLERNSWVLKTPSAWGPEERSRPRPKRPGALLGDLPHSYQQVNCDTGAKGKRVDELVWRESHGQPRFRIHGCPLESCDLGGSRVSGPLPACPRPRPKAQGHREGG